MKPTPAQWCQECAKTLKTPDEKLIELINASDIIKQTKTKTVLQSYHKKFKRGSVYYNGKKEEKDKLKEIYFCHIHNTKYVIFESGGKRKFETFQAEQNNVFVICSP